MERREFLSACALLGGAASLSSVAGGSDAWAQETPRLHARTRLVDVHGRTLRIGDLAAETNYVFQYPFAATPCLLLKLGRPVAVAATMKRQDGSAYAWQGGVGRDRNVVAFSAICAHKLAYPTREVSFIRYQSERSATSGGRVIHCCADHSVYDPAEGARVVSGPAPQPLAASCSTTMPRRTRCTRWAPSARSSSTRSSTSTGRGSRWNTATRARAARSPRPPSCAS